MNQSTDLRPLQNRLGRAVARSVALLALLAAVLLPAPAAAQERTAHFRFEVDRTYQDRFLTGFCGFDVFYRAQGGVNVTLSYDEGGRVAREIDTFPSYTVTTFAPASGRSYTSAAPLVLATEYHPDGTAVATYTGLSGIAYVPGAPPMGIVAGRLVVNAMVTGTSPEGIPLICPFGRPLFDVGVKGGYLPNVCTFLAS